MRQSESPGRPPCSPFSRRPSVVSHSASDTSLRSGRDARWESAHADGHAVLSAGAGSSTGDDDGDEDGRAAGPPRGSGPRPNSRFPLTPDGRCHHRAHWQRLRGKRGYTYYLCTKCLCGWRKPRGQNEPDEQ
eukprot:EG_transcript_8252